MGIKSIGNIKGEINVKKLKSFLDTLDDDYVITVCGESNLGMFMNPISKTIIVDNYNYLEEEFGE